MWEGEDGEGGRKTEMMSIVGKQMVAGKYEPICGKSGLGRQNCWFTWGSCLESLATLDQLAGRVGQLKKSFHGTDSLTAFLISF